MVPTLSSKSMLPLETQLCYHDKKSVTIFLLGNDHVQCNDLTNQHFTELLCSIVHVYLSAATKTNK